MNPPVETTRLAPSPATTTRESDQHTTDYPYRAANRWWHNVWVVPVTLVVISFLAYALPPYFKLDPALARIPHLHRDVWWHFPLLVGHIAFGTIALVTVVFQIIPWLRNRYPAIHRWIGRVYVFAGVLPTALLALAITPYSAGPPGNAAAALLWLFTTVMGYRMIRRRRVADHRRWMIYSFALSLQIVWGRVLLVLVLPRVPAFNFGNPNEVNLVLETVTWLGFVLNLLAAQIWLEWTARRARRATVSAATGDVR